VLLGHGAYLIKALRWGFGEKVTHPTTPRKTTT